MTGPSGEAVLNLYRAHAAKLGARFQGLSTSEIYAPGAEYLPATRSTVLDIGAGSGRDAIWFARHGHRVVAVEPVEAFAQQTARLAGSEAVEWVNDRLPDLTTLNDRDDTFDLVLVAAVWQHLTDDQQRAAFASLTRLMRPGGVLLMSLRHGPEVDDTLVFAIDPDRTISQAHSEGLKLASRVPAPSVQPDNAARGVCWTWLVFHRPDGETKR